MEKRKNGWCGLGLRIRCSRDGRHTNSTPVQPNNRCRGAQRPRAASVRPRSARRTVSILCMWNYEACSCSSWVTLGGHLVYPSYIKFTLFKKFMGKKTCLERLFGLPNIAKQCQNHNYTTEVTPPPKKKPLRKKAFLIFSLPWESRLYKLPNFKNLPFVFTEKNLGCLCSQGQFTLYTSRPTDRRERP